MDLLISTGAGSIILMVLVMLRANTGWVGVTIIYTYDYKWLCVLPIYTYDCDNQTQGIISRLDRYTDGLSYSP